MEEVTRLGVLCSESVDRGVVITPVVKTEDEEVADPNRPPLMPSLSSDEDEGSVDTITPPLPPLVDKEDVVFSDKLCEVVGVLVINVFEADIADDVIDGVPICSITKSEFSPNFCQVTRSRKAHRNI